MTPKILATPVLDGARQYAPTPDLDELDLQAPQGPVLDRIGQEQLVQEVSRVVGQEGKVKPYLIGDKPMEGDPGPMQQ